MIALVILFGILIFVPRNPWSQENLNTKTDNLTPSLINSENQLINGNSQALFLNPIEKSGPESPDFLFVEKVSLRAATPPNFINPQVFAALVGETEPEEVNKEIVEYTVEEGDSLWTIAEKFNISLNTILWANELTQSSILKIGQKLIIPPVSGVIHYVKAGDMISSIAQKYKAKPEEIIAFNELSSEADIYVGDVLVVPNGVIPPPPAPAAPVWVPLASSYFICPISAPCRRTQRLHWYNAIDFSHGQCGEAIFAAAGGEVIKVKFGWNGGAGNTIAIFHPNGVVTSYGHVAASLVNVGDKVSQGQMIALMGGQPGTSGSGRSTGCHLHFGVSGARNPFAY